VFARLDNFIFYLINRDFSNRFLDLLMPVFTFFGTTKFILLVIISLFVARKKELRTPAILLLVGFVLSAASASVLKTWIMRPRPFMVLPGVRVLTNSNGPSFPSGHSVNIFMLVAVITASFKNRKFLLLYIVAFGTALSRVYLGVHFPSDCLGGAIIGIIIAYLMIKLLNKIGFLSIMR